jgi:tRNA(fMet)-specific endonuclease VapC
MLNTDICAYLMANRFPALDRRASEQNEGVCISSITLGELSFGVENSERRDRNRAELELFCAKVEVINFDSNAARHYGEIRADFRRAGTPIGPLDLLIGAHARSLGMTLVTNNRREFDRIPGLTVENWLD